MKKLLFVAPLLAIALPITGCAVHVHHPHRPRHRVTVRKVVVKAPPPAPPRVVVVKGVCPGPKHIWVAGHHVHRHGRYVWVKGRWAVPPKHKTVWVKGRWSGGVWVAGHWK